MAKLFKSCGCCSLRVGVIIIGILDLVLHFLLFLPLSLATMDTQISTSYIGILAAITPISWVPAVFLLIGAFIYTKWYLLPWMIGTALHWLLTIFTMIMLLTIKNSVMTLIITELAGIVLILLYVYFFWAVLSLFFELRNEQRRNNERQSGKIVQRRQKTNEDVDEKRETVERLENIDKDRGKIQEQRVKFEDERKNNKKYRAYNKENKNTK